MSLVDPKKPYPLTLKQSACDLDIIMSELFLRKDTQPNLCFLIVEGPDEKAALQRHLGKNCTILQTDGRDGVFLFIKKAINYSVHNRLPLDGFVGLVDRDYDHLLQHQPPLPLRVAWTTPDFNDLESAAFYHSGKKLLEGFVHFERLATDDWLALRDGVAFDLLVERIVARVGALRAAYQESNPTTSLDPNGEEPLIDRVWQLASSSQDVDVQVLLKYLPLGISSTDRAKIEVRINSLLRTAGADTDILWDYIKGKDLVRALANALVGSAASLYDRTSVNKLSIRIHQSLLHTFDTAAVRDCGIHDAINNASSQDRIQYVYLKAV